MAISSALPRVLLSRGALEHAARAAARPGAVIDLRHDAFGHGLLESAAVLAGLGLSEVIVDDEDAGSRLAALGLGIRFDGTGDVDPAALFGIPDAGGKTSASARRPVMSLQGRVLSTKPLHAGEAVSYGYTHRAQADTRVALVTGGYAQGILRALGNRVRVQVGERMLPVVGRIAMDVCVVDLEGEDAPAGTPVVYFGGDGGARDGLAHWAAVSGLTPLEIAVVIGRHAQREWIA